MVVLGPGALALPTVDELAGRVAWIVTSRTRRLVDGSGPRFSYSPQSERSMGASAVSGITASSGTIAHACPKRAK